MDSGKEGVYYLCKKNKSADQLRGYCASDSFLCKKFVFNWEYRLNHSLLKAFSCLS